MAHQVKPEKLRWVEQLIAGDQPSRKDRTERHQLRHDSFVQLRLALLLKTADVVLEKVPGSGDRGPSATSIVLA